MRVCTFAHAHLSLRPGTEISCAGSNNDLCTVCKNSECCGEAAPATTGILCNHQCVVSMRQKMLPVRCNKNSSIKHLLVYQEKKPQSSNLFLNVISWEYDNSCAYTCRLHSILAVTLEKSTGHGETPELCWICSPNHELNHQLLGRAINCNVTGGQCARCHHQ